MTHQDNRPSPAEFLAGLVTGNAGITISEATVQRSHRFPVMLFTQIENMARMGSVPVSLIINQLLGCGLEAVKKELPEQVVKELSFITQEQVERPTKSSKVDIKWDKETGRAKPKSRPTKK